MGPRNTRPPMDNQHRELQHPSRLVGGSGGRYTRAGRTRECRREQPGDQVGAGFPPRRRGRVGVGHETTVRRPAPRTRAHGRTAPGRSTRVGYERRRRSVRIEESAGDFVRSRPHAKLVWNWCRWLGDDYTTDWVVWIDTVALLEEGKRLVGIDVRERPDLARK